MTITLNKILRRWGKGFLVAFLLSVFIRGCFFQSFKIASSGMEGTLFENEYILTQKVSYGARMPITLLSFPFLQRQFPFTSIPSYSDVLQLPYMRFPGRSIRQGEIIVFNSPEENNLPVDKRKRLLSRCVAISGDTLEIVRQNVYVNHKKYETGNEKYCYRVTTNGKKPDYKFLKKYDIRWGKSIVENNVYLFALGKKKEKALDSSDFVSNVELIENVIPVRTNNFISSIQNDAGNFIQPLIVPGTGVTIKLTQSNIDIYHDILKYSEGVNIEEKKGKFKINGQDKQFYTFTQDYYFVLNDNRVFNDDSRKWGFVPESHLIGKAGIVWFSKSQKAIRWNRILKSCM